MKIDKVQMGQELDRDGERGCQGVLAE